MMKYTYGAALSALAMLSAGQNAFAQASTLPAHGSMTADDPYSVSRAYAPSGYTDTTQNIQVSFTLTPSLNNAGVVQLPYASEVIELGVRDPNLSGNTDPIVYVAGTRTLVNPSSCTRSGVDNRTLNCNATINFPANLRTGANHMVYIRYRATSVYSGNTSLNWTGYYTLATMLSCSPQPACFTMGQPSSTSLTNWPSNPETNPLMPDFVDPNGDFVFDLDFSGMVNIPPECSDPMDPGYDPFLCEDICVLEPWTEICMGPSQVFFIDPPIATGYEYSIAGTSFAAVKAPSLSAVNDPDGYIISYLSSGVTASQSLLPGQSFTFPSAVTDFTVTGIAPSLAIDPADTAMFPMGVSVNGIPAQASPNIRITQTPIISNSTPSLPIANAGSDDTATAPSNVSLNGGDSSDPLNGTLTYNWTQVAGPIVALLNPQSATPNFWTLNVTTPTTLSFELQVEDSNGVQSAVDQVDIVINPSPKMPQCTAWNRDELVSSLNAYPEGGGYSVTQVIDGQVKTDLQNLANSLAAQHADFGRLEIKSYISNVGTGTSPILHGNSVNTLTPQSVNFTMPPSPAPTPFWTGGNFQPDTWYRWDTKINLWKANGYSLDGVHFGDDCVYQTAFFKIDGTSGGVQTQTRSGITIRSLRPVGQLNFGDVQKPLVGPQLKPMIGSGFIRSLPATKRVAPPIVDPVDKAKDKRKFPIIRKPMPVNR